MSAWALFVSSASAQPKDTVPFAKQAAGHRAFQVLSRPTVPQRLMIGRAATPVDFFLLERLTRVGLTFSPAADRRTLIRRASLDLLGLPPTPDEVEAFLGDPRPDAYDRLVDRLLASPRFGERWGRHWLDAAGYADVTGTDNDATIIRLAENRWLYRDYVIRTFNEDRPFRQFLLEQLAGDELVDWRSAEAFTPSIRETLVATGFLRTAADDTDENELNTLDIRYSVLHRTIETVATNLLGLTLACARCHDHKYEPILQADYYRFQAFFQPALNPQNWKQPKDRQVAMIGAAEKAKIERHNAELQKRIDELTKKKGTSKDKAEQGQLDGEIQKLGSQRRKWDNLQAIFDVDAPTPTRILKRGVYDRPGAEVAPAFFVALSDKPVDIPKPAGKTSGRRLALARMLTDAKTPAGSLALRVRVNRVWQQLFGRGLVETSDNLGLTGSTASHPELLDWLAAEFDAGGQRLKPLLRLLMTSTAYQQASAGPGPNSAADPREVDPDNRLLWRMPLRRLEAEALRDCILHVSGKLDVTASGPPVPVEPRPDGTFVAKGEGGNRRSVYLLARRNYHETFLGVFDMPNLTASCTKRTTSVVVGQALTLLNAPFVRDQAGFLATRIATAAETTDARIALAFAHVLGRPPSEREMTFSRDLLAKQAALQPSDQANRVALVHLCHMLLNTSEFLHVP